MNPLWGTILGTAVGDSIGLPSEGLSPQKIRRRWKGVWRQRLFLGRGLVSDDTEHTVLVAQCLIRHPNDAKAFQKRLAWKMRGWLLCIPAGIGFATLRAILKLCLGFSPEKSGVFSAGNGPAMRSAVIGVFFSDDEGLMREFVKRSTRLTHTDPKAETAALAVALTAAWAGAKEHSVLQAPAPEEMVVLWQSAGPDDSEWLSLIKKIMDGLGRDLSVEEFAHEMGLARGISGYAYHTVPMALYAWYRHFGDYADTLESVLNCGGDTDTVGAIAGALSGIQGDIPQKWVNGIRDFPVSTGYLRELAGSLDEVKTKGLEAKAAPPAFLWWALPFRNAFFLFVVVLHGFRRLVP